MPKKPKRLRLAKVNQDGYTLLTDKVGQEVKVSHEALVAILTGLADTGFVNRAAISESADATAALNDAAKHARRQLAGLAWSIGVCSWDSEFRAIERDANPFHQSD